MNTIETAYGPLSVAGVVEYYENGAVKSCSIVTKTCISTSAGDCIPQYTTDDVRKKTVQAIAFHKNGVVKNLPLETAALVDTPVGKISAELVTFHPNGALHRVFPLNGKLSGYWTQEDEAELAEPLSINTSAGVVTAKCISVCFDAAGVLKSLTLWPGEAVTLPTPAGKLQVRTGVSFRPDGSISSVEPALPQRVGTPVGDIQAFNPDAVGINGDTNSLEFSPQGGVCHVVTTLTRIIVTSDTGEIRIFAPENRESLCGNDDSEPVPLDIAFSEATVSIRATPDSPVENIPLAGNTIRTEPYSGLMAKSFTELRCSL